MIKRLFTFIFSLLILFVPCHLLSQDNTGMKFGINVDQVLKSDLDKNDHVYKPREVELTFYGPINHLFDGNISAAAHEEDGEFKFELHEAWVSSSSLVKDFEFKAGQYFLNIGRLNKTHRHEWPFISPPKFFEQMFEEEGVRDSGLEVTYRIPGELNLSLLAGIASGRTFGENESSANGKQPNLPTNYLRFGYFFEAFGWNGFDIGLNYLNRIDGEGNQSLFFGLDFIGKKKEGSSLKHLIQNEIWFKQTSLDDGSKDRNEIGTYFYYQYGINNDWAIGPRLDYFSDLTREDSAGNSVSHYDVRGVLSLTYKPTEFMRFKLDYSYGFEKEGGMEIQQTNMLEFQITFLLGAHPSHDF
jgi:hypothetical protein